jgi:hypothetical protein
MRVLHLDTGRELRGGQWQMVQLARALEEGGHEVRLLTRLAGYGEPISPGAVRRWSQWADITHCHCARSHSLAAVAARRPFVVSRRVAFPLQTGVLSRWKYRQAAHYLAVSEYVAAQLRVRGFGNTSVVADGVVIPERVSDRSGPLVALASDDPRKGGDLLRRTGLTIHFSDDLAADLLTARAFLYITDMEGLGSAALLAMAHGTPVIASRVGGLPEIVRHEETGLLVANDVDSIRLAVLSLDRWAARIAANARAMVVRDYTVARMAERTLEVYRKVLR